MRKFYVLYSLLPLMAVLVTWPGTLWAQRSVISGQVKSASFQSPLNNAQVVNKSDRSIVLTDRAGKFQINASPDDELIVSLSGYTPAIVSVNDRLEINVLLYDNPLGIDTSYQTLWGNPQKRKLSTAAVSEIYTTELEKTNSRSTAGLLVGRMPGLHGNQASGEPGADNVSLSLRGSNPFVMVDGTPQSFGAINPEQIESITLMKDALSTAMLGMRASNGILYITTKKGKEESQSISFKAMTGIQQPLKLPRTLDAYNYANLYNEATVNAGLSSFYSTQALEAYRNGSDPFSYPNVDWQDAVLEKKSSFSRYDLAVSGGSKISRYFVNLDYLDQGGLLKTSDVNTYNTNADFKRYGFRTNVGVDISRILTANINLGAQIQNGNEPGATVPAIFANILRTPNNAHPILNPDGSLAGTDNYTSNIWGQTINSGYQPYTQAEFKADLSLKANLGFLTRGLWARATGAYKTYLFENIKRTKMFEVYQMSVGALGDTTYTRRGPVATAMTNSGSVTSRNRMLYTEIAMGYDRDFGVHGINLLLNASNDNQQNGDNLDENFRGIAGRISYNFKEKYLAELAFGYNGVERYPTTNRYGFFPAVGLGWNVSEESFLKDVTWLDEFKLRASYGLTGNANAGYYVYNQYYVTGSAYNIGETPTNAGGIAQGASNIPYNPSITWEKAKKLNVGIDASFFANKLSLTAEYFEHSFYDLLQSPGTVSGIFGAPYPSLNIGELDRSGTELQFNYQDRAGRVNFFIQPNISLVKSKNTFIDEMEPQYAWQKRTGLPAGQPFGYIAEGLFQSNVEAMASPTIVNYTPQAGDIKYRDLNSDGIINANDVTAIGHQRPLTYYGVAFGFNFKAFDMNALVQGVENRQIWYTGASVWEFQNDGRSQAFEHHLNRWTPENAATATYPRLTVGTNINNHINSSFWLKSGDYLRLKSLEFGYTLPTSLSMKIGLATARVFVNGTNLLTKSQFNDVDPEIYTGGYPMQRMFSGGFNVKF